MSNELASPHRSADLLPLLWAKTARNGYHPLICHLLDVAAVAEALWDRALSQAVRGRVVRELGLIADEDARLWVTFFAALHDIGKASVFQWRDSEAVARLAAAGIVRLPTTDLREVPHGTVSTAALQALLVPEVGLSPAVAYRIAAVIGGHHGTFPRAEEVKTAMLPGRHPIWESTHRILIKQLADVLNLTNASLPSQLPDAAAMWLAGFVSVSDWIGSDQTVFKPYAVDGRDPAIDSAVYLEQARNRAAFALDRLGWQAPRPTATEPTFTELFPHVPAANAMQRAVVALGQRLAGPCLVVIEAQTGSGKSEAAMWLADRWATGEGRSGAYLALPTRATSDQMFSRVHRFLEQRYPAEVVNLLLLHGHAALSAEFDELRRMADRGLPADAANLIEPVGIAGEEGYDRAAAGIVAAEWFTFRKRGLLAPFGVGTVDQALLAVLQTRHYFVRLAGLTGRTVVFDEVHAYDTYMSTLFEQLLRWLAALGTSVVLLSATLPAARRAALLGAYRSGLETGSQRRQRRSNRPGPVAVESPTYPRLSWVSREGIDAESIPADGSATPRRVAIEWVDGSLPKEPHSGFAVGERLRDALRDGGCAAVICNTVGRAQDVYRALLPYFPSGAVLVDGTSDGPELDLLHARFLAREREERERRNLARFSKREREAPDRRPRRAVLVATQVIEQSLDLDFDLLITDLAPIDLLLQRIGRLHRHDRPGRPARLETPRVWISAPEVVDGAPELPSGDRHVYAPHVLLRSWLALQDRDQIVVPDDVEALIEGVYDDERACPADATPTLTERWETTHKVLRAERLRHKAKARRHLILSPGDGDELFEDRNAQLEEDDPAIHEDLQALTRLAEPTIGVVCLTPEEQARLLRAGTPTVKEAIKLLRHAVSIGNRRVFGALVDRPIPPGWKRSALLRHHRLLELDTSGRGDVGNGWAIRNGEVGIEIVPAG